MTEWSLGHPRIDSVRGQWGKQREILSSLTSRIAKTCFWMSTMLAHMCLLIWIIYWCFVFFLLALYTNEHSNVPSPDNDGQLSSLYDNYPFPFSPFNLNTKETFRVIYISSATSEKVLRLFGFAEFQFNFFLLCFRFFYSGKYSKFSNVKRVH